MTGIIIQARKGATRLPNKMVLPFYKDKGVLELLIEKLLSNFPTDNIVLATTDNPLDDELIAIAEKFRVKAFRGSEHNVLDRFISAAEKFDFQYIIRVCADNPFLDMDHIPLFIKEIESENTEYVSYKLPNGLPTIKSHTGLFTEAVALSALKRVKKNTSLPLYREHVTNYIYEHPEKFKLRLLNLPFYMEHTENIRLTLDTVEDFKIEQELYKTFKDKSTRALVAYLKNDDKLQERMKNEINRHTK